MKTNELGERVGGGGIFRQQAARASALTILFGGFVALSDVLGFNWKKVQKAIKNDGGGRPSYPSTHYGTLSTHD
jgi:hypothetical protein